MLNNGTLATYLTNKVPLYDIEGNIAGILGTSLDITARKKMEKELAKAREKLEASSKAQLNLLSLVNHESRNPMHVILGMSEVLMNKNMGSFESVEDCYQAFCQGLKGIHEQGNKLMRVINYIYDFVEQEWGNDPVPQDEIEIKKVLNWILEKYEPKLDLNKVIARIDYVSEVPDQIIVNSRRFMNILDALIGNAVKYTETGNIIINVSGKPLSTKKFELKISIQDTGCGIRKEYLKHIFEHFDFDAHKSYIGSGLTLSATKKRIDFLGGKIGIDSEVSKGTEVWFTLPVAVKKSLKNKAKVKKPVVLLIEDDALSAMVTKEMLNSSRCEVVIAKDGNEAKNLINKPKYDYNLILVDILLPDMYGFDLVSLIRSKLKNGDKIPIIAVTAQVTESDKDKCFAVGMDDIISKPVNFLTIKEILNEYLS